MTLNKTLDLNEIRRKMEEKEREISAVDIEIGLSRNSLDELTKLLGSSQEANSEFLNAYQRENDCLHELVQTRDNHMAEKLALEVQLREAESARHGNRFFAADPSDVTLTMNSSPVMSTSVGSPNKLDDKSSPLPATSASSAISVASSVSPVTRTASNDGKVVSERLGILTASLPKGQHTKAPIYVGQTLLQVLRKALDHRHLKHEGLYLQYDSEDNPGKQAPNSQKYIPWDWSAEPYVGQTVRVCPLITFDFAHRQRLSHERLTLHSPTLSMLSHLCSDCRKPLLWTQFFECEVCGSCFHSKCNQPDFCVPSEEYLSKAKERIEEETKNLLINSTSLSSTGPNLSEMFLVGSTANGNGAVGDGATPAQLSPDTAAVIQTLGKQTLPERSSSVPSVPALIQSPPDVKEIFFTQPTADSSSSTFPAKSSTSLAGADPADHDQDVFINEGEAIVDGVRVTLRPHHSTYSQSNESQLASSRSASRSVSRDPSPGQSPPQQRWRLQNSAQSSGTDQKLSVASGKNALRPQRSLGLGSVASLASASMGIVASTTAPGGSLSSLGNAARTTPARANHQSGAIPTTKIWSPPTANTKAGISQTIGQPAPGPSPMRENQSAVSISPPVTKPIRPATGTGPAGSSTNEDRWVLSMKEVELEQKVGSGSFGTVYKGNYFGPVAVKILNIDSPTPQQFTTFRNEVLTLKACRHPNVLEFSGYIREDSTFAIVTHWCEGSSLYKHLHVVDVCFEMSQLISIAEQVATGMHYLHMKGIIHRDLKSNNIFLHENFMVKIGDFGLATVKTRWEGDRQNRQPTGSILFVYAALALVEPRLWMAPEVIRMDGENPYTFRSDVYAYGIVLYELLTNSLPYSHVQLAKDMIMYWVGSGRLKPDPQKVRRNDVPKGLKSLMMECYSFERDKRPVFEQIIERLKQLPNPRIKRSRSDSDIVYHWENNTGSDASKQTAAAAVTSAANLTDDAATATVVMRSRPPAKTENQSALSATSGGGGSGSSHGVGGAFLSLFGDSRRPKNAFGTHVAASPAATTSAKVIG